MPTRAAKRAGGGLLGTYRAAKPGGAGAVARKKTDDAASGAGSRALQEIAREARANRRKVRLWRVKCSRGGPWGTRLECAL